MDKPRVDEIRGIPPAIAIEQANPVEVLALHRRHDDGDQRLLEAALAARWPARFCPSCGREIRPRNRASRSRTEIGLAARFARAKTVLITFWVAVPAKTEPREFFEFHPAAGLSPRLARTAKSSASIPTKRSSRLGARVQVIQDRITITDENRPRLVEAIETALRFGKDRSTSSRSASEQSQSAIRNPNIPSPPAGIARIAISISVRRRPGLFSFNSPLGACPECRGFGRTIAIDLNRAIPDRSLSHRAGRGARFPRRRNGRIAKGSAARLRARGDRRRISFRGIAEEPTRSS